MSNKTKNRFTESTKCQHTLEKKHVWLCIIFMWVVTINKLYGLKTKFWIKT